MRAHFWHLIAIAIGRVHTWGRGVLKNIEKSAYVLYGRPHGVLESGGYRESWDFSRLPPTRIKRTSIQEHM